VLAIHSLLEYPLWYTYFLAIAAFLLGAFDETKYRFAQRNIWRISLAVILLLGLLSLIQLRSGYQQLKDTMEIRPVSGNAAQAYQRAREGLLALQSSLLLSPYAEMFIIASAGVGDDHLKQKIAVGSNVMRFNPNARVVYRQAFFLAQDGQLEQAKRLLEQAIWSYPDNSDAHQLLQNLAEKDPAHFSALLEFALQKEQEYTRAVHHQ
jgi:tetratricopeptide (TPR) repeat protein